MAASTAFDADIVATFGRHVRVRAADGTEHDARPLGRRLDLVCGDRVRCEHDAHHDEVRVSDLVPRRTVLLRSNARAEAEAVVANVTHVVAVVAPLPVPDCFIVDRYLAAAHSGGMTGLVVANKADEGPTEALSAELDAYGALGVDVIRASAKSGMGIDALRLTLQRATAVLVGQSGVGKSSLINALVPRARIGTADLVRQTEEGRHTTTASRRYDLGEASFLIDSPGVRDFSPAIDRLEPRGLGFIDIERFAVSCRFADCRHLREPDCAVIAAVGSGEMSARRYESYRRMRRLFEDLTQRRGPARRRRDAGPS
jgi:ribosome biogenesis GTPase